MNTKHLAFALILTISAVVAWFAIRPVFEGIFLYRDAEEFAEEVVEFKNHFVDSMAEFGDEQALKESLELERFAALRRRQIDANDRPDILVWFNANRRFNIGIGKDMGIVWDEKGTE